MLIRYSLLYAYPHKQPQLRGFASIEDQLALKKFGYSENVDRNCEHDKDYYLEYELDGADNDENEEESVPTNADASYDSVGVLDEPVPGQIDTNQGANDVSPGGLTGGTVASYHTAWSHNPSIVSDFPLRPRASTRETRGRRSVTRLDL